MIKTIDRADGKRHQVYGKRDGRKVYIGTYNSKREAIAAEEDIRVTQRKIEAGTLPRHTDSKLMFGVAATRWITQLKESGSRSWEEYERRVKLHLLPVFDHVPIVNIKKSDIIKWRDQVELVSGATVNTVLGTLSSAFAFFVDRDWIAANPCGHVKSVKHATPVFPWLQSVEVVTRLLSECTPNIRTIIAVLVGTGLRLDEALHLRWDDIDLEHRLITVHRGRKGTTKAGKARHVPIFDSVLVVLRAMKLTRGTNMHLWPGGKPGKPLSQPAVRAPFKRALEHAELSKKMRIHDMRHSFASLYLIDGGDIFKLSKILGHSSVAITERTYAHVMPTAFEADYGRVAFRMPSDAKVLAFADAG